MPSCPSQIKKDQPKLISLPKIKLRSKKIRTKLKNECRYRVLVIILRNKKKMKFLSNKITHKQRISTEESA